MTMPEQKPKTTDTKLLEKVSSKHYIYGVDGIGIVNSTVLLSLEEYTKEVINEARASERERCIKTLLEYKKGWVQKATKQEKKEFTDWEKGYAEAQECEISAFVDLVISALTPDAKT